MDYCIILPLSDFLTELEKKKLIKENGVFNLDSYLADFEIYLNKVVHKINKNITVYVLNLAVPSCWKGLYVVCGSEKLKDIDLFVKKMEKTHEILDYDAINRYINKLLV